MKSLAPAAKPLEKGPALYSPENEEQINSYPSQAPRKEPEPQLVYSIDDNDDDAEDKNENVQKNEPDYWKLKIFWTERRRKELSLSAQ